MFDEQLWQFLVDQTSLYAALKLNPRWKMVTVEERKGFVAVILNMGVIQLKGIKDYWSTKHTIDLPFFRSFFVWPLLWNFSTATCRQCHQRSQASQDPATSGSAVSSFQVPLFSIPACRHRWVYGYFQRESWLQTVPEGKAPSMGNQGICPGWQQKWLCAKYVHILRKRNDTTSTRTLTHRSCSANLDGGVAQYGIQSSCGQFLQQSLACTGTKKNRDNSYW